TRCLGSGVFGEDGDGGHRTILLPHTITGRCRHRKQSRRSWLPRRTNGEQKTLDSQSRERDDRLPESVVPEPPCESNRQSGRGGRRDGRGIFPHAWSETTSRLD